jgi:hypothetical protein
MWVGYVTGKAGNGAGFGFNTFYGYYFAASPFDSVFSPLVGSTTGIGIGPPGELGSLAVKTSTPSAVTRRVCSI